MKYYLTKTTLAALGTAVALLVPAPANASTWGMRGGNWCDPGNKTYTELIYPDGITSSSTTTEAAAVADAIASDDESVGINIDRIAINPASVANSGWLSVFQAYVNELIADGISVDIQASDTDTNGFIPNMSDWQTMWQTIDGIYSGNNGVYYEPINEPHGYSSESVLATDVYEPFLGFIKKSQSHIILDGTGFSDNVSVLGGDTHFTGCLLSLHDYGYWNPKYTNETQWETQFTQAVGNYASRTVVTEYGASATTGLDYGVSVTTNNMISAIRAISYEVNHLGMGSMCFPAHRDRDTYRLFSTIGGDIVNLSLAKEFEAGWGIDDPPYVFPHNTDGWISKHSLSALGWNDGGLWQGGIIYADQTNYDAYLWGPVCNFVGEPNTMINVEMYVQNPATNGHDMQAFWTTTESNFSQSLSSPMMFYTCSNNFTAVNIPLNGHSATYWDGQTITRMRQDVDQVDTGARFIIGSITPQSVTQYTFDSDSQGWTSGPNMDQLGWVTNSLYPGVIYADVTNADGYFVGPTGYNYLAGANDTMRVHILVQNNLMNTNQHFLKLYWRISGDGGFDETKTTGLVPYTATNNGWAYVFLPVSQNTNWSDNLITQLRLDVDDNSANEVGTRFLIDSICAYSTNPPSQWTFDYDVQDWNSIHSLQSLNYTNSSAFPGCMWAYQTGADSWITSPNISYFGSSNDTVQVHVYATGGPSSNRWMQLNWASGSATGFAVSRSTPIIGYTASNSWATVTLPVGQNPDWSTNLITLLRLDLDDNSTNSIGTTWYIDSVTVVP